MTTLGQANPYFVRCIKPNGAKVADKFVPQMVLNQLKYSGMMETVRIRRLGYPVRRTFDDFLFRYNVLGRNLHLEGKEVPQSCAAIMQKHDSSRKDWQTGKTKVTTSLSLPTYLCMYFYLPVSVCLSLQISIPPFHTLCLCHCLTFPPSLFLSPHSLSPFSLPLFLWVSFVSFFLLVSLPTFTSLHPSLSLLLVAISLSFSLHSSLPLPSCPSFLPPSLFLSLWLSIFLSLSLAMCQLFCY